MLTKRDKAIIKDIERFRVMDRDSIAEIHFANLKNPNQAANTVLLRLIREGHLQRSTSFSPYVYFSSDSQMKKNSAKINHFLAILEVYKEMKQIGQLETFMVEPKYVPKGDGAEPDIYAVYRKTPFFIEVQKSVYSEKVMNEKLDRYIDLYNSGVFENTFPRLLILSEQRYAIDKDYPLKVFQSQSFKQFVNSLKPNPVQQPVKVENGIKIKLG